jgi:hypothetical protein
MSTQPITRKYKFNFSDDENAKNSWQVERILQQMGSFISQLVLTGVLYDSELVQLLKNVPNCRDLNLDQCRVITTMDTVHRLHLSHLRHLTINENTSQWLLDCGSTKVELLNNFRLPDDCLTSVSFITSFDANFEALDRFLKNQIKIEKFVLKYTSACSCIPDDFLNQCELQKLWISFGLVDIRDQTLSEVKESIENFRSRQMSLRDARVDEI